MSTESAVVYLGGARGRVADLPPPILACTPITTAFFLSRGGGEQTLEGLLRTGEFFPSPQNSLGVAAGTGGTPPGGGGTLGGVPLAP